MTDNDDDNIICGGLYPDDSGDICVLCNRPRAEHGQDDDND